MSTPEIGEGRQNSIAIIFKHISQTSLSERQVVIEECGLGIQK